MSNNNSASATLGRATDSTSVLDLKRAIIRDLKLIWELKDIDERKKPLSGYGSSIILLKTLIKTN